MHVHVPMICAYVGLDFGLGFLMKHQKEIDQVRLFQNPSTPLSWFPELLSRGWMLSNKISEISPDKIFDYESKVSQEIFCLYPYHSPKFLISKIKEGIIAGNANIVQSCLENPALFHDSADPLQVVQLLQKELKEVQIAPLGEPSLNSLSSNPALSLDFFLKNPTLMDYKLLADNSNLFAKVSVESAGKFLRENLTRLGPGDDLLHIFRNPSVPLTFVRNMLCNLDNIASMPIPGDFLQKKALRNLSMNHGIPFDLFQDYELLLSDEDLEQLALHSDVPFQFITRGTRSNFILSLSYNLPLLVLKEKIQKGTVDWAGLSSNRGIWKRIAESELMQVLQTVW